MLTESGALEMAELTDQEISAASLPLPRSGGIFSI
jgi:hypothetical protein